MASTQHTGLLGIMLETLLTTIFNYTYYTELLVHTSAILNTFHSAFAKTTVQQTSVHKRQKWLLSETFAPLLERKTNYSNIGDFIAFIAMKLSVSQKEAVNVQQQRVMLVTVQSITDVTSIVWSILCIITEVHYKWSCQSDYSFKDYKPNFKLWDLTYSFKHLGQYSEKLAYKNARKRNEHESNFVFFGCISLYLKLLLLVLSWPFGCENVRTFSVAFNMAIILADQLNHNWDFICCSCIFLFFFYF